MYDCRKFEIVDFINFVQCKGNCLLLRSEHYLERHIGRTQYFRNISVSYTHLTLPTSDLV